MYFINILKELLSYEKVNFNSNYCDIFEQETVWKDIQFKNKNV